MGEVNVTSVFFYALITALATGLGALPFFFFKSISKYWIGIFNAIAGGLMLSASIGLIYEGVALSLARVMLGVLAGLVFIVISRKLLE